MLDLIAHNLAPIMFISVMAMLLLGYPVAFTLAAGGLFYFVVGVGLSELAPDQINLYWPLLGAQPDRVFGIMSNDTLLAIPFFTLMGLVLERSGMAEDLLDTIGQLFGPIRGGLAYAVVLVGALLAATTGVVAASVIAMGLISLPIMQRYGYDQRLASGSIAASGTLAQIVPPSLVLIVMADQLGVSVGDMYLGALIPAMIIVGIYCLYVLGLSIFRPDMVPALPPEARTLGSGFTSLGAMLVAAIVIYIVSSQMVYSGMTDATRVVAASSTSVILVYFATLLNRLLNLGFLSRLTEQVVIVLIPPLALVFLVLGTIFLGIATPTEGGAMGAVGALLLAFAKRRLDFATLRSAVEATAILSAFVMFILIGARVFALTFYGVNGNVWMEELLLSLPGGQYGFLIVITIIVFILGCFLDFFEIAFILVPLLAPVAVALDIDLVWFGIILGINLQTSFLTPPFGFSLFYLRSVAPAKEWTDTVTGRRLPPVLTSEIYKGVLPFIGIQFLMILLVIAVPGLVQQRERTAPIVVPPAAVQPGPSQEEGETVTPLGLSGLPPFGSSQAGDANTSYKLPGPPPFSRSEARSAEPTAVQSGPPPFDRGQAGTPQPQTGLEGSPPFSAPSIKSPDD